MNLTLKNIFMKCEIICRARNVLKTLPGLTGLKALKDARQFMIVLAAIAITSLLMASCVTQKACLAKFPPEKVTKDSIVYKDKIVKHDTTIFVTISGKVVHDSVPVPVYIDKNGKPEPMNVAPITKETQFAKASAYIRNGVLHLDLEQKDYSIAKTIKDAIQNHTITKSEVKSTDSTIVIKPKWKPDFWSFLIGAVIVLGIIYGLAKLKNKV